MTLSTHTLEFDTLEDELKWYQDYEAELWRQAKRLAIKIGQMEDALDPFDPPPDNIKKMINRRYLISVEDGNVSRHIKKLKQMIGQQKFVHTVTPDTDIKNLGKTNVQESVASDELAEIEEELFRAIVLRADIDHRIQLYDARIQPLQDKVLITAVEPVDKIHWKKYIYDTGGIFKRIIWVNNKVEKLGPSIVRTLQKRAALEIQMDNLLTKITKLEAAIKMAKQEIAMNESFETKEEEIEWLKKYQDYIDRRSNHLAQRLVPLVTNSELVFFTPADPKKWEHFRWGASTFWINKGYKGNIPAVAKMMKEIFVFSNELVRTREALRVLTGAMNNEVNESYEDMNDEERIEWLGSLVGDLEHQLSLMSVRLSPFITAREVTFQKERAVPAREWLSIKDELGEESSWVRKNVAEQNPGVVRMLKRDARIEKVFYRAKKELRELEDKIGQRHLGEGIEDLPLEGKAVHESVDPFSNLQFNTNTEKAEWLRHYRRELADRQLAISRQLDKLDPYVSEKPLNDEQSKVYDALMAKIGRLEDIIVDVKRELLHTEATIRREATQQQIKKSKESISEEIDFKNAQQELEWYEKYSADLTSQFSRVYKRVDKFLRSGKAVVGDEQFLPGDWIQEWLLDRRADTRVLIRIIGDGSVDVVRVFNLIKRWYDLAYEIERTTDKILELKTTQKVSK